MYYTSTDVQFPIGLYLKHRRPAACLVGGPIGKDEALWGISLIFFIVWIWLGKPRTEASELSQQNKAHETIRQYAIWSMYIQNMWLHTSKSIAPVLSGLPYKTQAGRQAAMSGVILVTRWFYGGIVYPRATWIDLCAAVFLFQSYLRVQDSLGCDCATIVNLKFILMG